MKPFDFTDKRFLITGASSGIGRETAIQLSQLGAKLLLIARREDELKNTLEMLSGKGHCYSVLDVGNFDAFVDLIKLDVKKNGAKFDGAVHAAGFSKNIPLRLISREHLDAMFRVHFHAFVAILKCAASKRCFNENASVVGISSCVSKTGSKAHGVYSAAKTAMNNLSMSATTELKSRSVRINTVCPYYVDTDMIKDAGLDSDKVLSVEEVVNLIVPLLSYNLRAVSGTSIDIGFTMETMPINRV